MNKRFTDIFIQRPVLALVVNLVIVIAGLQAIRTLNVRQYPRSESASVTVTTVYVGASAELVRGFITTPLERAIAAADGIDYIQSQSSLGVSTITVRLRLNYDPLMALSEISSKVDQVRGDLPPESEVPVINVESAETQFASAYLSFTSDILEQNEITDYLLRVVQPRLTAIEGVQRAEILGSRTFAMRVWLNPNRMAAYNISPLQVRQSLAANNVLTALGQTKGSLVQVNLVANTNLSSVEEFRNIVIREQGGAFVRLRDIAEVELGAEDYDSEVRFSGQTAVETCPCAVLQQEIAQVAQIIVPDPHYPAAVLYRFQGQRSQRVHISDIHPAQPQFAPGTEMSGTGRSSAVAALGAECHQAPDADAVGDHALSLVVSRRIEIDQTQLMPEFVAVNADLTGGREAAVAGQFGQQ